MTHDERIDAIARALQRRARQRCGWPWSDDDFNSLMQSHKIALLENAEAALAAAGVEEMVREAAREAWDLGCMSETSDIEQRNQDAEEIVREVMGK